MFFEASLAFRSRTASLVGGEESAGGRVSLPESPLGRQGPLKRPCPQDHQLRPHPASRLGSHFGIIWEITVVRGAAKQWFPRSLCNKA